MQKIDPYEIVLESSPNIEKRDKSLKDIIASILKFESVRKTYNEVLFSKMIGDSKEDHHVENVLGYLKNKLDILAFERKGKQILKIISIDNDLNIDIELEIYETSKNEACLHPEIKVTGQRNKAAVAFAKLIERSMKKSEFISAFKINKANSIWSFDNEFTIKSTNGLITLNFLLAQKNVVHVTVNSDDKSELIATLEEDHIKFYPVQSRCAQIIKDNLNFYLTRCYVNQEQIPESLNFVLDKETVDIDKLLENTDENNHVIKEYYVVIANQIVKVENIESIVLTDTGYYQITCTDNSILTVPQSCIFTVDKVSPKISQAEKIIQKAMQ